MVSKTQSVIPSSIPLETIYEESGGSVSSPAVDVQYHPNNFEQSSTLWLNKTTNGLISARSLPTVDVHQRRRVHGHEQKPPIEVRYRDGTKGYIEPSLATRPSANNRRLFPRTSRIDSSISTKISTKSRQIPNATSKKKKKLPEKPKVIVTVISAEDLSLAGITPPSTSSIEDSDTLQLTKSHSSSSVDTITMGKDVLSNDIEQVPSKQTSNQQIQTQIQQLPKQQISLQQVLTQQLPTQPVITHQLSKQQISIQPTQQISRQQIPVQQLLRQEITNPQVQKQQTPVQQAPVQQISVQQMQRQQVQLQQVSKQQPPVQPTSVQQALKQQTSIQQVLKQQVPMQPVSSQQIQTQQTLMPQIPKQSVPLQQIPVQSAPKQQAPLHAVPIQQTLIQQIPKQQVQLQQTPVRQAPIHSVPAQQTLTPQISKQQVQLQQTVVQQTPQQQTTIQQASTRQFSIPTLPPSVQTDRPAVDISISNLRFPFFPRHRSQHQEKPGNSEHSSSNRSHSLPPASQQAQTNFSVGHTVVTNQNPPAAAETAPLQHKTAPSLQITLKNGENENNSSSIIHNRSSSTSSARSVDDKIKNDVNRSLPLLAPNVVGGPRSAFRPFLKPATFHPPVRLSSATNTQAQTSMNQSRQNLSNQHTTRTVHPQQYLPPSLPSTMNFRTQSSSSTNTGTYDQHTINSDVLKQSAQSTTSNHPTSDKTTSNNSQRLSRKSAATTTNSSSHQSSTTNDQMKDVNDRLLITDPNLQWHSVTSKCLLEVPRLSIKYSHIPLRITLPQRSPTHNQKLLHRHNAALENRLLNAGLSPETVALYERVLQVADVR